MARKKKKKVAKTIGYEEPMEGYYWSFNHSIFQGFGYIVTYSHKYLGSKKIAKFLKLEDALEFVRSKKVIKNA